MQSISNIIIMEPELDQAVAIAKYLKSCNSDFRLIGWSEKKIKFFLKSSYFDFYVYKKFDDIKPLNGVDLVIPAGAYSTRKLLSKICRLRVGSVGFEKSNLIFCDKKAAIELAEKVKIPVPITYKDPEEIDRFPVFYKEAYEAGLGRRGVARNKKELLKISAEGGLIYQEYIDDPVTYGVGFIARDGLLQTYFIHKEILSLPRLGGSGVILEKNLSSDRLIEYTEKILKTIGYNGWGLAEFKFCKKRRDFVFMEVNPKFWASIEFALLNNTNFMQLLFGVNCVARSPNRVLYVDRLVMLGMKETIANLPYVFKSRLLNTGRLPYGIAYLMFFNLFPGMVRSWIIKIIKGSQF